MWEYLNYKNCKCRKKLADKLIEECTETAEEIKIAEHEKKSCFCILYIASFSILLQLTFELVLVLFTTNT